ncbi:acyltransferase [Pseudomonas sp. TH04]|uniref:acyltransferase family protein n=1 Tax=Pseudomonas sp. TH04 TaxID=2796370 RepID=UPI0019124C74|nr:acyltransferase [Pseudomonas sp. TH04]MBK5543329.1 acyltransferase [Pseudomonas sp. TH04]
MKKNIHYAGADGIRGLACLIVLCVHAMALFFSASYMPLVGTGKIGVWLFFVLSAFLLTGKFEVGGFSLRVILIYALGRFLRIIPLFALVAYLYYLLGTIQINTILDLQNAILLQQGFGHLWTIPVEFKFYIFLPIIAFVLIKAKGYGGYSATFFMAAVLILMQQWLWPYRDVVGGSISTRGYLSSFTIGCYFAVSFEFYRKYITAMFSTIVGLVVVVLMVLSSPYMRNLLFGMPMDDWLVNKFFYLSLLWGLFIVALADGKGAIGTILQSKIMKRLGAWSFSIYLVHWYFYAKFSLANPNSILWMCIAVACAVLFGAILHYAVEAPIEKFRHSIQGRIRPTIVASL